MKKLCGIVLMFSALILGCAHGGVSKEERTAAYAAIKESVARLEQDDSWKTDPTVLVHLLYGKKLEIPTHYRKLPDSDLKEAIEHHMQAIREKAEGSFVQWPAILGAGQLACAVAVIIDKRGDAPLGGDNLTLSGQSVTNAAGTKRFVITFSKPREQNKPNEAGVTPPRLAETWGIPPQAKVVVSMRLNVQNMFPIVYGDGKSELITLSLHGDDLEVSYQGPRCEWPPYQERLPYLSASPFNPHHFPEDAGVVRIDNESLSPVKVGIRSDAKGIDLVAPAKLFVSTWLPEGKYDIYFQYAHDPESLYQGDSFEMEAGRKISISMKKKTGGNYNIRKVK